ncbi:TIGR04282 family arsenosugar biosynthesis glycosyltransferase [uncultured Cetobacterium sp.]|uniref:TIGR04282 family arsenosugar biosynthesis glycosyltransferase n=1 Tax=uncultured Cetobacterium sp. TaxID=527638 RepID=UPI002607182C|nr:TIGR04282 family arsenosugar biosynthesis glycosyltransferase [uncultured Cetobacterium sp.]
MNAMVIMTRIPVPNKTKTRLLTILTPQECAHIHMAFLKDIIKTCSNIENTDLYIFYGNEGPLNIIDNLLKDNIKVFPQKGIDLGEKMKNIFSELFQKGYTKVVLMGADIPEVKKEDIDNAFLKLQNKDIVFGPTLDGGYYLVGMNKLYPLIFNSNIKWGTPEVFQETINSIRESGLKVDTISTHEDIDTKEDLLSFNKRIEKNDLCKNTKIYIDENIKEKLICQKN